MLRRGAATVSGLATLAGCSALDGGESDGDDGGQASPETTTAEPVRASAIVRVPEPGRLRVVYTSVQSQGATLSVTASTGTETKEATLEEIGTERTFEFDPSATVDVRVVASVDDRSSVVFDRRLSAEDGTYLDVEEAGADCPTDDGDESGVGANVLGGASVYVYPEDDVVSTRFTSREHPATTLRVVGEGEDGSRKEATLSQPGRTAELAFPDGTEVTVTATLVNCGDETLVVQKTATL